MKIYTKTGDDGTTGLFGGGRVRKDHLRIEAYGTVDELNSAIGIARTLSRHAELNGILHKIQNSLFQLGADLATPYTVENKLIVRMADTDVMEIEKQIDRIDETLPELKNFILPGGSGLSAYLHLARNICRRAERLAVALSASENIGPFVTVYLNRLSDLLFVLARWANQLEGVEDREWNRG